MGIDQKAWSLRKIIANDERREIKSSERSIEKVKLKLV